MAVQLWDIAHPGIYIEWGKQPGFFKDACRALNRIREGPTGAAMLKSIAARSLMSDEAITVTIVFDEYGQGSAATASFSGFVQCNDELGRTRSEIDFCDYVAGEGSEVTIRWHNTETVLEDGHKVAPFIILAHEMVHAYHYIHGVAWRPAGDMDTMTRDDFNLIEDHEEARTVGLGGYSNEAICENAIRREQKKLRRKKGILKVKGTFTRRKVYGFLKLSNIRRKLKG
jgi:hypothetical protein